MYLFILGRQPELSLAELSAVFGTDNITKLGRTMAVSAVDFPAGFKPDFLGGIIKVCRILDGEITDHLPADGKVTLGLSSDILPAKKLQQIAMNIKKKRGSVRIIPNKTAELSSATVFQNKLAKNQNSGNKFEFYITKNFIAQTIYVQNLDAYTFRDREKPGRDARNGMLPPKLAQIMVNLAAGATVGKKVLLDPFCGTGTTLIESALRGFTVYGTDLEPAMISHTKTNLEWLARTHHIKTNSTLAVGDATDFKWELKPDFIACETYLGKPYMTLPIHAELMKNIQTCDIILTKFQQNLHAQIDKNTGICIGVPTWFTPNENYHLPLISKLEKLGYIQKTNTLIYHRENQIVGRELLVLQKK